MLLRCEPLRARPLPDSSACRARYWRIDSGMASHSSPVSMLFLANSLIFARLEERRQQEAIFRIVQWWWGFSGIGRRRTCSETKSARSVPSY